ncbi:MAG: hypothetical protein IT580_01125 [Verrucomicrobiales bacterium]|nr:hypothetical protein [Verrucomicrobiales bacterium]
MSTLEPPRTPSAARILAFLLGPAALCFLVGFASTGSDDNVTIPLMMFFWIVGSLVGGITSGILLARRLASHSAHFTWIAAGLALACTVVAVIICFGGCLVGVVGGNDLFH